jgi:hypothetical protein
MWGNSVRRCERAAARAARTPARHRGRRKIRTRSGTGSSASRPAGASRPLAPHGSSTDVPALRRVRLPKPGPSEPRSRYEQSGSEHAAACYAAATGLRQEPDAGSARPGRSFQAQAAARGGPQRMTRRGSSRMETSGRTPAKLTAGAPCHKAEQNAERRARQAPRARAGRGNGHARPVPGRRAEAAPDEMATSR